MKVKGKKEEKEEVVSEVKMRIQSTNALHSHYQNQISAASFWPLFLYSLSQNKIRWSIGREEFRRVWGVVQSRKFSTKVFELLCEWECFCIETLVRALCVCDCPTKTVGFSLSPSLFLVPCACKSDSCTAHECERCRQGRCADSSVLGNGSLFLFGVGRKREGGLLFRISTSLTFFTLTHVQTLWQTERLLCVLFTIISILFGKATLWL